MPPESTAEISVAAGLAGAAAGIELTSDQPVTGSVISEAIGTDALPDLAVQSAAAPIVRTGVVPLVHLDKTEAELVLSNGGDERRALSFDVYGYDGVKIDDDDVLLVPHATATRRLDVGEAAYLVVSVAGERVSGRRGDVPRVLGGHRRSGHACRSPHRTWPAEPRRWSSTRPSGADTHGASGRERSPRREANSADPLVLHPVFGVEVR